MTKAFDLLLAECKLTDRTDPVVTMVAKLVIELVRNGERDPEKIRQKIIGGVKGRSLAGEARRKGLKARKGSPA